MSAQTFDNTIAMLGPTSSTVASQSPLEVRAAAVRAVCGLARDAVEAAEVLEALGLDPREGRQP